MTTLAITPAEWASVQDGHLWLVREGTWPKACPLTDPTDCNGEHCDCPLAPPVEFVQACAPCEPSAPWFERLHPGCNYLPGHFSGGALYCNKCGMMNHCPDCRIELVGPCPDCDAEGYYQKRFPDGGRASWPCDHRNTVTLGHAYAVGQPLPICHLTQPRTTPNLVATPNGVTHNPAHVPYNAPDLTTALAHYGDPESLIGKWAQRVQVTP